MLANKPSNQVRIKQLHKMWMYRNNKGIHIIRDNQTIAEILAYDLGRGVQFSMTRRNSGKTIYIREGRQRINIEAPISDSRYWVLGNKKAGIKTRRVTDAHLEGVVSMLINKGVSLVVVKG